MSRSRKPLTDRQKKLKLIARHPEKAADAITHCATPEEKWDRLFHYWLGLLALEKPGEHNPPLPSKHTEALPGTAKKIKILRERATAKQNLWHPHEDLFCLSGIFDHIQRMATDCGNGRAKKPGITDGSQELYLAGTRNHVRKKRRRPTLATHQGNPHAS